MYLKDGSVVRGTFVPSGDPSITRIRIMGGSEFNYTAGQIDSVAREPSTTPQQTLQYVRVRKPRTLKEKGYKFTFEHIWFLKRDIIRENQFVTVNFRQATGLRFINGYQFNERFYAGGGTGFDFAEGFDGAEMFIPLYAHATAEFLKKPITPFGFANVGYRIGVKRAVQTSYESISGGAMTELGIGLRINTPNRSQWHLSAGYNYHWSKRSYMEWWSGALVNESLRLSYWNISWGVSF